MFTIGKLVRQADVSADTVRYYEQQGLLSPATRTAAGYRLYDNRALRRLHFVRAVGWLETLQPLRQSQKIFEIIGALVLILSGLYMLNAYFFLIPQLAG